MPTPVVPALLSAVLLSLQFVTSSALNTATAKDTRPNIVYIMTDDQDIELGGLTPMNKTRKLLGDDGAVGEAFYIATPICCPSRTETFSGRLYHNVLTDDLSGCMHTNATGYTFQHEAAIYPALQASGYLTGGFGKILNGQGQIFVPKDTKKEPVTSGFDWLSLPLDEGDYFANMFFEKRPNGTTWVSSLGKKAEVVDTWYQTSQIGNRSLEFIRHAVAQKRPFAAYLGPHAPHYSADAPPWAQELFSDMQAPRTPAYNTSRGQLEKTQHVAQNPPFNAEMEKYIDIHFRDRWRSISGVDDMIALVIEELDRLQVLDNTYVFLSSDHGYKLGQWRLGCSKEHPYETDVHIPFFARGPGIAPGTRLAALGSNIDIAPTFMEIAGLRPNPEHDGQSLLPMLHSKQGSPERLAIEASWRHSLLIQYIAVGTYYNDHAKLWLSGPSAQPGNPPTYGAGPFAIDASMKAEECPRTENHTVGEVGKGRCWFVDSQESNNWAAVRVRNATHNYIYVESFGSKAMNAPTPGGPGIGIYECLEGDLCQTELYHYGPIASEYPNYPIMTDERWSIDNAYRSTSPAAKHQLRHDLREAYCSTRRLDVDRFGCGK